MCPHEEFCHEKTRIAQTTEQTISVSSTNGEGFTDEALCSYKFEFSTFAGPGDKMNVEFITAVNAAVTFTVGTSFSNAIHGSKFQNP